MIKAIVEEGGITRAKESVHLSQSASSYQLKEAEQQLGPPSFTGGKKRLVLTPVGERRYETAKRILQELDEADEGVKRMPNGEQGTMRTSTEYYTNYHWLTAVLRNFEREFPRVEVEIVFEATLRPLEKLTAGQLDLRLPATRRR